ncbi:DUF4062 domain-containing protein [Aliarcobacter butzleri]|uniref:DUF4062 domain-containing protein n=1 Tax=Aliarcobacter butzleri TaxID=28197 RepID=UPI0021B43C0E|nr:DUF4062 domain-containing protein [Aliarcobacter butzleri]MCT7603924.1 DUF4062 domain-containing protein [Aliarcobacter butzleri]
MQSKIFRLFVSSTFEDFIVERDLLQSDVFPYIEKYCMDRGFSFQVVDLRWGVTEEAQLDQKTMQICLNEVNICKNYPKPNFIILLGNRYGWVPLPYKIEAKEFEFLLNYANQLEKSYLKKWFFLDENEIPSSYFLNQRNNKFVNQQNWLKEENRLRKILQKLVTKSNLREDLKNKYFLSATEQESLFGIFDKTSSNTDNVFAYFKEYSEDDCQQLTKFKNKLKNILKDDNIVNNLDNDSFVFNIKNYLKKNIENHIKYLSKSDINSLELEQHRKFMNDRTDIFVDRVKEIDIIKQYIYSNKNQAFMITGISGIGKSSVLAKLISEIKDKKVIYRFVGITEKSSSIRELLISICNEIEYRDFYEDNSYSFFKQVKNIFEQVKDDTIIFIDAIDQLIEKNDIVWLPDVLPKTLKIVVTALNDNRYEKDKFYFIQLSNKINSRNILTLESLSKISSVKQILRNYLKKDLRKITDEQMKYIISKYKMVKTPLYLRIVAETIKNWKSYENTDSLFLQNSVKGQIELYINDLSTKYHHPKIIVEKVFNYINISKYGLREIELIRLLRNDGDIQELITSNYFDFPNNKLPIIFWLRLFFDIKHFIKYLNIDNLIYFKFFHREFNCDVINKNYHVELAKYFSNSNKKYDVFRNIFHLYELDKKSEIRDILLTHSNLLSFISNNDMSFIKIVLTDIFETNNFLLEINFYDINYFENIDIKNIVKYLKSALYEDFLYNENLENTYKLVRTLIYLFQNVYLEERFFLELLYEYSHLLSNIIDETRKEIYNQVCLECYFEFDSNVIEDFCPSCKSIYMRSKLSDSNEKIQVDIRHIPDEAFLNINSRNNESIQERNISFKNLNKLFQNNDFQVEEINLKEFISKQEEIAKQESELKSKDFESIIKLELSKINKKQF